MTAQESTRKQREAGPAPSTFHRSLARDVQAALGRVYDPCSLAANNPLSLIDMGLVREWTIDGEGHLMVRLCVTTPSCLMAPKLIDAARQELRKVAGIEQVTIDVDPSVFWTPELMSSRGKRTVRRRHQRSRRVANVRPQQWRE
jgi:metal-sulfur cluster biosynthetic enzyme